MSEDDLNRVYVPTWDEPKISIAAYVAAGDRLFVDDIPGWNDYFQVYKRELADGKTVFTIEESLAEGVSARRKIVLANDAQVSYQKRLE